jgi:hypothetical protein
MTEEDEAFNEIERRAKQRKEAVRAAITKGKTMNNPPAFPTGNIAPNTFGMTLRDYFAAKAMQGMMVDVYEPNCDYIAKTAYEMADAMMNAREA